MPDQTEVPPSLLRHFAADGDAVRRLAAGNPSFGDMCEEFAEAEAALKRIETLPAGLREERLEECQGWIERLIAEMGDVLSAAKVVPLPHRSVGRPP